jgi:hypothetical protein
LTYTWGFENKGLSVKGCLKILGALVCFAICVSARADRPVFGNHPSGGGPAYNLTWYDYMSSGGEVGFTPYADMTLSSVTLWLTGYNGDNGLTFDAMIYNNFYGQPGFEVASLIAPTPNDGSDAAFTFTDSSSSTTLETGEEYWLIIYATGTNPSEPVGATWDSGGLPYGDALYDGSQGYNESYSGTPAFTLNTVPEPGSECIMGIPLLIWLGAKLYKDRKPFILGICVPGVSDRSPKLHRQSSSHVRNNNQ